MNISHRTSLRKWLCPLQVYHPHLLAKFCERKENDHSYNKPLNKELILSTRDSSTFYSLPISFEWQIAVKFIYIITYTYFKQVLLLKYCFLPIENQHSYISVLFTL